MHWVIGLGYGDEGKGSLVDALSRRAAAVGKKVAVIRFNGGPQAAHHVVTERGQSHCFAQLGSGMLVPRTTTHLSRYMLLDPPALLREAEALVALGVHAPLSRLVIDERCVVVTPFHKILNRMQEVARGTNRHGSCGLGVGQAWLDSQNASLPTIRIHQARDEAVLARSLRFMQLIKIDQGEQLVARHSQVPALRTYLSELQRGDWVARLVEAYRALLQQIAQLDDGERLREVIADETYEPLFEGAQGVLLDAEHGFWPHVTPSRTTFENAQRILIDCAWQRPRQRLGILRAYATRHGVGPFVTHDGNLESLLPERHNLTNPWQGEMRVGWFDAVAARYAIAASGGSDAVAISCLDRLDGQKILRVCVGYRFCDPTGNEVVIERIPFEPGATREQRTALSEQLLSCQPIYQELPGWDHARQGDALSPNAESFVRFLESSAGLGTPISIVSCGPTAADKLYRSNLQDRTS